MIHDSMLKGLQVGVDLIILSTSGYISMYAKLLTTSCIIANFYVNLNNIGQHNN